jgi:threonine aldolase
VGTIYSKQELEDIRSACNKYDLPLFVDGARLGYGLTSPACDIDLPTLARLADAFYIGGTKVGALFGEAVIITAEKAKRDFHYSIKRQGGMRAKSHLLGIQFETHFHHSLKSESLRSKFKHSSLKTINKTFENKKDNKGYWF